MRIERSTPWCGLLALVVMWPVTACAHPRPVINVVLVHGFWNTGQIFDPLVAVLERHDCACYAPTLEPNDFGGGVRDLSVKLAAKIDAHFGRAEPFIVVAFSMGGLVARDYVQNLGHGDRVRALFLISTANDGTLWAATSPRPGVRQLAPGSAFLRRLNTDLSAWRDIPVRAYWTPLDLIVFPSPNSRCGFGDNRIVWCPWHSWMARDSAVMSDIAMRIDAVRSADVLPFTSAASGR